MTTERQKLALRALAFYENDWVHGVDIWRFLTDNGYLRDSRASWAGSKGWQNTLHSLARLSLVDTRYPPQGPLPQPPGALFRLNDAGREAVATA